jgi:hypothetical protein
LFHKLHLPENLTCGNVDAALWHDAKASLRMTGYELAQIADPWRLGYNFVIANIPITLQKKKNLYTRT